MDGQPRPLLGRQIGRDQQDTGVHRHQALRPGQQRVDVHLLDLLHVTEKQTKAGQQRFQGCSIAGIVAVKRRQLGEELGGGMPDAGARMLEKADQF